MGDRSMQADSSSSCPQGTVSKISPTHKEDRLSFTGRVWLPPQQSEATYATPADWCDILLRNRNITADTQRGFLSPTLKDMPAPHLMADLVHASRRLAKAIHKQEPIVVYGDYDVDGVTSTAILVEFLKSLGASVSYYIPDRRAEGYGLNGEAVARLATTAAIIVAVDCGSTSVSEAELAQAQGCDLIVVDHHQLADPMPPAYAILNPHRKDCGYPFKDLCAAGGVFLLTCGLRAHLRDENFFTPDRPEPDVRTLLDLVALATVADMVPLVGVNRILVQAGLLWLRSGRRPGIAALCAQIKCTPKTLRASDLGFRLGPRVNARGRLEHAGMSVDMFLAQSRTVADPYARKLEEANAERRKVQQATVEAALAQVADNALHTRAGMVVWGDDWHPGVLGLVASRLVSLFHRPVIALGEDGKGSARSIVGVHVHQAISAAKSKLASFGGHPMAAGLTLLDFPRGINAFAEIFDGQIRKQIGAPPYRPTLEPEIYLHPDRADRDGLAVLRDLEPYGLGNPEPLFVAYDVPVQRHRWVGDGHLQLGLGDSDISAIAFSLPDPGKEVPKRLDIAYHLEENVFRGVSRIQLRIRDLREAQPVSV